MVKVTPTSKVVGDLALYLISGDIDPDDLEEDPASQDLPDSVLGFLRGELGEPPGGWPEPFRSRALADRETDDDSEDDEISEEDRDALPTGGGVNLERRSTLNRLLLPGPTAEKTEADEKYGDVSVVPTKAFLYGLETGEELAVDLEPGVRLYVSLETVMEPDERGIRTLLVSLNGQSRPVDAQDRSREPEVPAHEKADPDEPGHVAAPMMGVVTLSVEEGEEVEEGRQIGTMEAMKMESSIGAPLSGTVERLVVQSGVNVESGDLLLVIQTG